MKLGELGELSFLRGDNCGGTSEISALAEPALDQPFLWF